MDRNKQGGKSNVRNKFVPIHTQFPFHCLRLQFLVNVDDLFGNEGMF